MRMRITTASAVALSLIGLAACAPGSARWMDAATVTATFAATSTATISATESPTATAAPTSTPGPPARRVLIISFDGLRPEAIELAPMPVLQSLMKISAYTLEAQTVFPSATLPAHSSMVGGTCPAKHGVLWNDYLPSLGYAHGTDLFDLAHAAGLRTVLYVGKEKLQQIAEPGSVDLYRFINDRDLAIVDELIKEFPRDFGVMLVHFPLVDMMGHEHGWLSPEQLSVAFRGDQALARLLATLDETGVRDETLIIVTADHGGHGTTHGFSRPEDMTIPWIASGPGIQPGRLTWRVQTMDTAATAAWALGLTIPDAWDGRPVLEAFGVEVGTPIAVQCPRPVLR